MEQSSRASTIIWWIILNLLWYVSAVEGMMNNEHHFLAVFKFFTWFLIVMWSFNVLGKHVAAATGQDYPIFKRYISGYAAFVSDFGLAIIAAAYGHWVYAALIMFQDLLEQMYFYKPETKERNLP